MVRRSVFVLCLFLVCLFAFNSVGSAASRVEYILDDSGSMNALFGGEKRIDAAKKSIASMLQGIPDGSIVALRLYAHRVAPSDKAASCKDTELVIPFGPINKQQLMNVVNAATPLGQTPIAYSLEQAANDFTPGADEQQTIILVSDGEESCGGDPVATAKALLAKGFKLKINVIGLDVDANAKNQLASIATATGGQYFDARDTAGLTSSLQKLTQESLVIQKAGSSIYGEEIRGGDNYETAVPLAVGKLFRLNHHQKKNQYDYFYIDAKPGQKIIASIETGEKGVDIRNDNTYQENLNPYAGISLQSPQKMLIKQEEIIGGKNDSRQIIFPVPLGGQGRYYILIGSGYEDQHKDHRFKVDIVEQFDAGTQQDAGDTRDTALTIQPGTIKGFLNPNDAVDTYKVTLPAGNLNLKVRPTSEKALLRLELSDADGVEVAHQQAPNEGAVAKIENLALTKSGEYVLKVLSVYSSSPETEYSLEIMPGAGTVPVAGQEVPSTAPAVPAAPVIPPVGGPPAATPPLAPVQPVPAAPVMGAAPTAMMTGGLSCADYYKGLPFLQKAKLFFMYVACPGLVIFFIGWLFGYVMGRKTGKRKALAKIAKAAPPASPPPPVK
jgi:Mg-chelatase subunit ChlD